MCLVASLSSILANPPLLDSTHLGLIYALVEVKALLVTSRCKILFLSSVPADPAQLSGHAAWNCSGTEQSPNVHQSAPMACILTEMDTPRFRAFLFMKHRFAGPVVSTYAGQK
ncbi:hypothetical protein N7475_003422 [Penicillium sp. IBT 31633x]|nr:hypothetical protein N7475_003422 [Penicillium sp. IBT 31633x]